MQCFSISQGPLYKDIFTPQSSNQLSKWPAISINGVKCDETMYVVAHSDHSHHKTQTDTARCWETVKVLTLDVITCSVL